MNQANSIQTPPPPICCTPPVATFRLCALLTACGAAWADSPPAPIELPTIQVIGTAPLPGVERPLNQIPSNIRHLGAKSLDDAQDVSLTDALATRLPGVNLNETQGNPFQADLNYRGFTASPLLGTAQGLSVYVDGVRANTPFGDTVNWDMIPQVALDSLTVIPGSNPLFGLNTLGGAIAIATKDGFRFRGSAAEAKVGSFGRKSLEVEHGGNNGTLGYYVAASKYREDGWRDYSQSDVQQFFGKISWRDASTELDLSLSHGDAELTGNGLLPTSMLRQKREQIFTHPDTTWNNQTQLTLSASHWLDDTSRLSGNLYYRTSKTRTLNGDGNDEFENGPNDLAAGGTGLNIDSAANNRTRTQQESWGMAGQWSQVTGDHQYALGASLDLASANFRQSEQIGFLDASRGVVPTDDEELENKLSGRTRTASIYFTDTWALTPALHLTAAARYNHTRIQNTDKLNATAPNLDADYTYKKLNPALGLTWQAAPALTLFGGFNQGNRAPTPIELGCADPANPCSLPNSMAADPYLKQVVARTLEVGARGRLLGNVGWSAALYRTNNIDDILFIGTSTSQGYFTNFGKTRRDGFELAFDGKAGSVDWQVSYGWIKATFQDSACLLAENNSSRGTAAACTASGQDDEILVKSGDRLPGIPEHSLKLGLRWHAAPGWRLGADVVAFSSQYLRGNENNQHQAGTSTDALGSSRNFENSGKTAGYAVLNLKADYQLAREWSLFGSVNNVFDKHYATGGALAENPFDGSGAFVPDSDQWRRESFVAPGAPRSFWLGVRYRLPG
jgi:outer membrane receptor protein involved in Fe transport